MNSKILKKQSIIKDLFDTWGRKKKIFSVQILVSNLSAKFFANK